MNTKKILLAGIAFGALASTGASAAVLSAARVSGIPLAVASGTTTQRITIADSAIFAASPSTRFVSLGNTSAGVGTGFANSTFTTSGTAADAKTAIDTSANTFSAIINPTSTVTVFQPNTPGVGNAKSFKVTFALDGAGDPRFVNALTAANFIPVYQSTTAVTTACVVSAFTPTSGGVANGNSVTAVFSVTDQAGGLGGCLPANAPQGAALVGAPIKLNALGAANLTATFRNPGDDSIFDGAAATGALVQTASVYDVGAADRQDGTGFGNGNVVPTVFAIGTGTLYTAILTGTGYDAIIGRLKATYVAASTVTGVSFGRSPSNTSASTVATLFSGLDAAALPNIAPDALFTNVGGKFDVFTPAVAGLTVTVVAPARTTATGTAAATATGLAAVNVTATTIGTPTTSVSTPQVSNVTIRAVPATLLNPSATASSPLETIGQQGTVINAPWFGGSKAATPSWVRLTSTAGTGGISLTLNNAVYATGDTPGATTCTVATSIAAGGELIIDSAKAKTCFGDFVRGDIQIVVNGSQSGLTAKMRVASTNGTVSELSLSNLPATQVTSQ